MNSGATAERIYDAVKRRILTGGYRPGERIEVMALAQALDSSVTPVRDALHLLVGERLVETRTGDGFHLPQLDTPALSDLYAWNANLLLQALRNWDPMDRPAPESLRKSDDADAAVAITALFASIAARTGNAEYEREIGSLNDRLHRARIAESTLIRDWREEIASLRAAFDQADVAKLRRALNAYHRRRRRKVTEIIRTLHQLGGDG
jgi:DNA-binding GntR family transcriptional regulator